MSKLYVVAFMMMTVVACGKKDEKGATGAAASGAGAATSGSAASNGDCIVGEYERDDNGIRRGLVFNADKSGRDVEPGKERPITWSLKDEKKVWLLYPPSGDQGAGEFAIPYDCSVGTVGHPGTTYKRK